MAYPADVTAVATVPSGATALGSGSPTHTVSHDQYRTALRSFLDKVDPGVFVVTGLVENNDTTAAANTALIQAALDAATAYGVTHPPMHPYLAGDHKSGATVIVPPGFYYIDRSVLSGLTHMCLWVGDCTTFKGAGMGTRLRVKSGTGTNASPCGGIGVRPNTSYVAIQDITIDGAHGAGETITDTSNSCHGIDIRRSGNSDMYDGAFHMKNVMIFGWQGNGFQGDGGTNTLRAWDIYSYHNRGSGFIMKTDQAYWGCKAGNNQGDGYYMYGGTDVQLFGCKAFGGVRGFVITYSESILLSNCQAEDWQGDAAFYLSVIRGCQVNGVVYRCQSNTGYATPLWVEDAGTAQTDPYSTQRPFANVIDIAFYNVTADNVTYFKPKYGLITRHLGAACQIRMTAAPDSWAIGRHNSLGGSSDGQISWNSSAQDSVVTPTAFATPYTPDPELGEVNLMPTLTANLTVNAPVYPWRGQRLTFILTQGASAYTVTWNSVFKLDGNAFAMPGTNGVKMVVSFLCDGTNWQEVSRRRLDATGSGGGTAPIETLGVALSDEATTITTGTAKVTMRMPYAMTLTAVRASVNTVSSSGVVTVDINEGGTTILSTKLTIDASEKTSTTAAAAAVISDATLADDAEVTFDIDTAGTGAKGLKVWLIGTR